MTNLVVFALFVLASARIVRLIAADKLSEPFRDWIQHRYGAESMITYLFCCRACLSIWVCGLLSPLVFVFGDWSWWWLPLTALSGSHLVVLLSQLED